jgi:hypothetical protein
MKKRLIVTLATALILVATLSLPALALVEQTVPASVTVTQPVIISITISGAAAAGIDFGSQLPGAIGVLETHSSDVLPSIVVTLEAGSNDNVTLQIMGTNFGTGFPVTNAKYSLGYAGGKTDMSTTYTPFAPNVGPGSSRPLWHWLDVPSSGVTAGAYSSTFSYKAIAH